MPGYFCCRSFLKIIKEVEKTKYKNYDEMPLMLSVHDGFPTLKIGARVVIPRDRFIEWINKNVSK